MAVGMHRLHPIDFWGQNAPRSSDLGSVPDEARIAGVTMGAKNGSASLSHMDVLVRADVLPDNVLLGRDLEKRAERPSQMSVLPLGRRCAPLMF